MPLTILADSECMENDPEKITCAALATSSFLAFAHLAVHVRVFEPEGIGGRVENDAWYNVSEWFDGNELIKDSAEMQPAPSSRRRSISSAARYCRTRLSRPKCRLRIVDPLASVTHFQDTHVIAHRAFLSGYASAVITTLRDGLWAISFRTARQVVLIRVFHLSLLHYIDVELTGRSAWLRLTPA